MVVCLTQPWRSVLVHEPAARPDLEPPPRRCGRAEASWQPHGLPWAPLCARPIRPLALRPVRRRGGECSPRSGPEGGPQPRLPGPRACIGNESGSSLGLLYRRTCQLLTSVQRDVPASGDLLASLPNSTRTAVSGNSPNTIRHMRKTSLNGRIQGKLYLPHDQPVNCTKPKFAVTQNPHKS